jgi:hypothetical protein
MDTEGQDTNQERIARLLENIEQDVRSLRQLLGASVATGESSYYHPTSTSGDPEDQAIEGYFDGERMVDESGKGYQVSANYASKSKLVEGDPLKLYITADGKFFYKQLGPIERKTVPAVLRAEGNHYVVDAEDDHTYNVLTASVTYYMSLYNIRPGDRVMLLLPADRQATWAVIDNVL